MNFGHYSLNLNEKIPEKKNKTCWQKPENNNRLKRFVGRKLKIMTDARDLMK